MRYFHAKRFLLAFSMQMTLCGIEVVAAVRSWIAVCRRIVKCQISYLHRYRDARHLQNDVHTIIYIYIYILTAQVLHGLGGARPN